MRKFIVSYVVLVWRVMPLMLPHPIQTAKVRNAAYEMHYVMPIMTQNLQIVICSVIVVVSISLEIMIKVKTPTVLTMLIVRLYPHNIYNTLTHMQRALLVMKLNCVHC